MTEWLEQHTWFRLLFDDISWYQMNKEPGKQQESVFCQRSLNQVWCSSCSVIFFTVKIHKSTKNYLTQMLLAINWRYWQVGKKFTYVYEGSRSPYASIFHWNPPGSCKKKNKIGYFSNRIVYCTKTLLKLTVKFLHSGLIIYYSEASRWANCIVLQ